MAAIAALDQSARPFCAKYSTKIKWIVPAQRDHTAFTGWFSNRYQAKK